ncbi:hypothetical protein F5051DRAFT_153154 [Lentinula edodes]|nr:hypothetical protein F5051DRAFT_153154 [Lentinula edodes]
MEQTIFSLFLTSLTRIWLTFILSNSRHGLLVLRYSFRMRTILNESFHVLIGAHNRVQLNSRNAGPISIRAMSSKTRDVAFLRRLASLIHDL